MFICEIGLFDWYFPQFCTSDMSKYGYLEVFQRVQSNDNESLLCFHSPETYKSHDMTKPTKWQVHSGTGQTQISLGICHSNQSLLSARR